MTSSGKAESRLNKFEAEAMAHLDTLLKASRRILHNPHDAEDVVQDTYMRAWRYFDSFEAGTNCRAWLFRIMFNVINGRKSREARNAETPIEEVTNRPGDKVIQMDPLKRIEGREVLDATKQLSDDQRSVLWLVAVEEFSYREAAEILDVPIGTVMSRLHRARGELRRVLGNDRAAGTSG